MQTIPLTETRLFMPVYQDVELRSLADVLFAEERWSTSRKEKQLIENAAQHSERQNDC